MKLEIKALVQKIRFKKLAGVFSGAVIGFLALNLIIFFVFLNRTYPNSVLDGSKLGSVSYANLNTKLSNNSLLPNKLTLNDANHQIGVTPTELGVSQNNSNILSQLKRKSWLPLANFFTRHLAKLVLSVDYTKMDAELGMVATQYNKTPVGAKISLVNGKFTLVNDTTGYNLKTNSAADDIISAFSADRKTVILPLDQIQPSVTTLSLEPNLKSLASQQDLSITYTYGNKSTSPSAADIANWYVIDNNTYTLSSAKLESYIKTVGNQDGIVIANLTTAVSTTQSALGKLSHLDFTLTALPNTPCTPNALPELIVVSISQQHLWACDGNSEAYSSPVVTGDEQYADTLTPVGTYRVYAKETDKTLIGSDQNGSWDDFVNYWMPFLHNQYGTYGLHDATWRPASAFGNITPDTSNASNGCVELPLATATWLFNWSEIDTVVKIES